MPTATSRSIQLRKNPSSMATMIGPDEQHVWPLQVEATSQNTDPNIFVYRVGHDLGEDKYEGVASAFQMSDLPVQRPAKGDVMSFYRKNTIDQRFVNPEDLEETWELIKEHTAMLLNNLEAADMGRGTVIHDVTGKAFAPTPMPDLDLAYWLPIAPTGTPTVDGTGQGIDATEAALASYYDAIITDYPDLSAAPLTEPTPFFDGGWLPVEILPESFRQTPPARAKFWLNMAAHPLLKGAYKYIDLASSGEVMLFFNGVKLPRGVVYDLTVDTIWWLDFSDSAVAQWSKSGNAPWPLDFTDRNNPGTDPGQLEITIFRTTS